MNRPRCAIHYNMPISRRTLLAGPALLATPVAAQARLSVLASFSILADMARQVGGERAAVTALVGPGVEPHGFEPRPADAAALSTTGLVLRNGLGFEPWLDRLIRAATYRGPVATASEGITPRLVESRGPRVPDPHAWQDLRLGQSYVRRIAIALEAADPDGAAAYRENAARYLTRLGELDLWVRAQIASVPAARRKVVTTHEAFDYFGAAYGVTFLAAQGVTGDADPSAAGLARLIRQIRAERVSALFLETRANPAALRRIAEETGAAIGGTLYADTLSPPDGPAPSYEAMFRHNVGMLVPAMRGKG